MDESINSLMLLREPNVHGAVMTAELPIAPRQAGVVCVNEPPLTGAAQQPPIACPPDHEGIHESIAARYAEGCCPAQIFAALRSDGLDPRATVAALQHVLGAALEPREADALLRGSPGFDLENSPSVIDVPGREVKLLMNIDKPRIMLFGGLLDDDECDEVMRIAESRLKPSTHSYDGAKVTESLDDAHELRRGSAASRTHRGVRPS